MTKKNQNFEMIAGDTKDITVKVSGISSLDGASVKWAVMRSGRTTVVYKATGSGITASGNSFTIRLDAEDTAALRGRFAHEAEVTDVLGNVSTVMQGQVNIEPSGLGSALEVELRGEAGIELSGARTNAVNSKSYSSLKARLDGDFTDLSARMDTLNINNTFTGAFGGIMSSLDAGECASIQVIGDSTGNENLEWVYLTAQWLASQYPAVRVQHKLWNDVTQSYDDWSVIQDTPSGERHALFAGNSRTMYLPPANIPAITGDIDIRVKCSLNNWSPTANQTLVARFGPAGSRAWYLQVNTTGRLAFNWSVDGTALLSKASTNPLGFSAGATMWLRVTLDVDNGSGGYTTTFYSSADGVNWTTIGSSVDTTSGAISLFNPTAQEYEIGGRGFVGEPVGGKIFETQIRQGIDGPIVNPQPVDVWVPRSLSGSNPAATFGGSPTLYVVNGSKPGGGLTYFSDSIRLPKMAQPYSGALVFLSSSHNEGDTIGPALVAMWDSFLSALKTRLPGSAFCVITQNPQIAPRTIDQTKPHAQRRRELLAWAARNGLYALDTFKAFLEDPRGLSALINSDGIHPSNTPSNYAGSKLWSDMVKAAFISRK